MLSGWAQLFLTNPRISQIPGFFHDYSGFFKFHDFTIHGTFFCDSPVFHDFQSLWEPCLYKHICLLVFCRSNSFRLYSFYALADALDLMLWLFVGPTGVYLLDFFCSGIQFYLLLSPYLCFISLFYLDFYVLGDDALIS